MVLITSNFRLQQIYDRLEFLLVMVSPSIDYINFEREENYPNDYLLFWIVFELLRREHPTLALSIYTHSRKP